ncbi:hypothetical protein AB0M39_40170 [Streptomyces sp. NPDC051907]|uniref:hypothetical protein n=1 Tax=Streptomyces sp. NPDC051907 TaxID=3155284 RepID=UPI00343FA4A6
MAGGGSIWSAVGEVGAAGLSALGLVLAGIVAARATASAARTSNEAQEAVRASKTAELAERDLLVRALARSYDEMRAWAKNPVGPPPEPNERTRLFIETGT